MHDRTERGRVANAFADRVCDGYTHRETDELTDSVAYADPPPVGRSAQRILRHGPLGLRRRYSPISLLRPWRHVGGAFAPDRSHDDRDLVRR
jgi:hypothetical protein